MTTNGYAGVNVMIVGGGFCGAMVARRLDSQPGFEVTLVDSTPYFEYIPGVPRIPFNRGVEDGLTVPYEEFLPHTRCIEGMATEITPESVTVGDERIAFDVCLFATGSEQPVQIENTSGVHTLMWVADGKEVRRCLPAAERVLVVGGGVLGTEVAAELTTRSPEKRVTLVDGLDRLLERNPQGASEYARRFLQTRGVRIIMRELVMEHEGEDYITRGGRRIRADLAIWCTVPRPNPPRMEGFGGGIRTERGALRVNENLNLVGHSHVFVGGDITSIQEEKTAQSAEKHAEVIAENIVRARNDEPLESYVPVSRPLVISLGGRCGLMTYPRRYLPGVIPGLLKWGIERSVLMAYKG